MARKDRLKEVYEYVREHYPVHSQTDFADVLKYNRAYISSAMHGNEKNLTDKLFRNICEAFPGVFDLNYLLNGKGFLLTFEEEARAETFRMEHEQQPQQPFDINSVINKAVEISVSGKDEIIKVLKSQIEDKDRIIKLLEQKIEVLEAMQHIDAEDPLQNYPFPTGVADGNKKDNMRV